MSLSEAPTSLVSLSKNKVFFSSSLTHLTNKLECLSLASLCSLVLYVRVRSERTRVERCPGAPFLSLIHSSKV
jgi:hypothetical protein